MLKNNDYNAKYLVESFVTFQITASICIFVDRKGWLNFLIIYVCVT